MAYGDTLVQREVMGGFVWSAIPVRDVSHAEEVIALYRHRATQCWWPSHPKAEHPPFSAVTQSPSAWTDFAGCVTITQPDWDYSISLLWNPDWSLRCWYVDIIRPYERSPIGWDFTDHHLDLIVEATGEIWTKDEEDLVEAVERGELSVEEAARAHERVAELRQQALDGEGVFGEDWPDWRPDPSWRPLRFLDSVGEVLAGSPTRWDAMLDRAWILPA